MKTFKEYYDLGLEHHKKWLSYQKEEWWKDKKSFEYLSPNGDYIETVNLLSVNEKNDASLFHNHTNVKNSEWCILFSMLGQALIDWCRENTKWKDLWCFRIDISRLVDGESNIYSCSFSVSRWDEKTKVDVKATDQKSLKKFEGCCDFLCDLVDEFLMKHGKNVPNDWNRFCFGLDDLRESCKWGFWVPSSDGYMDLMNMNPKDTAEDYDLFVECM